MWECWWGVGSVSVPESNGLVGLLSGAIMVGAGYGLMKRPGRRRRRRDEEEGMNLAYEPVDVIDNSFSINDTGVRK